MISLSQENANARGGRAFDPEKAETLAYRDQFLCNHTDRSFFPTTEICLRGAAMAQNQGNRKVKTLDQEGGGGSQLMVRLD